MDGAEVEELEVDKNLRINLEPLSPKQRLQLDNYSSKSSLRATVT